MDTKTLDKIKSAVFPATPEGKILADSQRVIGDITDGFTNPGNISTQKVNLTDKVKEAGLTVKQFVDAYGSVELSEADAVQYVADQVAQCASTAVAPAAPGTDKAKRLRLAKAKIAIADADRARLKMKAA